MKKLLKRTSPELEKAVAYMKSKDVAQYNRMIGVLAKMHPMHGTVRSFAWRSLALDLVKEMTRGLSYRMVARIFEMGA